MKKRVNNIRVIKDEVNPETPEVLAASIIKIAAAMDKLATTGGLTDDAIAALIVNMRGNSHLNKTEVITVLEGLNRLKSYYIRKS
jgi:hypothetical protein